MSRDPLLQPFQLGRLTLKNRIITTAHEPAYPEDGMPKARYRAYHEERAKAGVAMAMTAGSAIVSRDSPPAFNNILAYRDEVVPWMRELSDALHGHGCAVMIQITHLGRRTGWSKGDWLPSLSSTNLPEPAHRATPKLAEDWDLDRIVADYADAAERMAEAGLDGVEIEAYGHLLDQFWSPLTNQMDGENGGDLTNRMRLSMRVLEAVRERVGPDFHLGVRFTADETIPGGLTEEDGLEIAKRLEASGLIDFLNVIRGNVSTDADLTDVIPIAGMASAPHLDFAGRVKAATSLPVLHAARIADVATARHAVESGKLDLVGMTRAHMADPHIVAKIASGREDEIRPCVGATYCLDRIYEGGAALCVHNPSTGRETTQPHDIAPSERRRRVAIVGAGPAGLEAARVAAHRGHHVTVWEAASEPGGQINLLTRLARRRELIGIVDWRMSQCAAMDVEFRFNAYAEAEDVTAEGPDDVIVATGGAPQEGWVEGEALTTSAWDLISGAAAPGRDVLIFDGAGDHVALTAAEIAAAAGAKVEIVTPDRTFSPEVMGMNLTPYMRALQPAGARMTVGWRLKAVAREGNGLAATFGTDYSATTRQATYDQVVLSPPTAAMDEVYFDLKPLSRNLGAVDQSALIEGRAQTLNGGPSDGFRLFRIGDAVSGRNIHAAIYDALRLVRTI